ncbi:MAG: hypothetical protein AB2L17_02680 [Lentimicrobium sp.]
MAKEKALLPMVCIIWDNEQYPECLGSATGKVHNRKTFEKENFNKYDLIYLIAEPIWDRKLRSDFYGFELGKELREKHHVLCPIIFCSFLKQEHFFSLKIEGSEILNYPGHYSLQLPDKPVTDFYQGIDEDTLEDINLSLFNPEQIVHNLMHNTEDALPGLIYSLKNDTKGVMKERASELLSKQLKVFGQKVEQGNENKFETLCEEFIRSICSTIDSFETEKKFLLSEAQTLRQPFKLYKPQLYDLLPKKMQEGLTEPVKPKRWQVLFIDDDQSNCDVVCEYFKLNGITCHTATDAKKVYTILKEDEEQSKKISMLIADFRLYENGDSIKGKWQDYQGYRILDEIHSNPDFKSHYVYAILTSKTGTIQKRIQKQSKFPVLWFSKSDVLGGGQSSFNLFCKDIKKVGLDAFIKNRSIPVQGGWTNSVPAKVDVDFNYLHLYKLHIEDNDYEKAEMEINKLADKYALLNEIPDALTLCPSFNKKDRPNKMLEIFRNTILLHRRIFIYLRYIALTIDDDIFSFFNPKYSPDVSRLKTGSKRVNDSEEQLAEKRRKESMTGVFNTNWGFNLNPGTLKIQDILLEEELQFLNGHGFDNSKMNSEELIDLYLCLIDIKTIKWGLDIENKLNIILTKFDSDSENSITYREVKELFESLAMEMNTNYNLHLALRETNFIKDYWNDKLEISQQMNLLIEILIPDSE